MTGRHSARRAKRKKTKSHTGSSYTRTNDDTLCFRWHRIVLCIRHRPSYIYKMLSAEDVPGMVQFFHICERDKKRNLPSTPFLRAWLVAEFGAKNRAIRDPAVRPHKSHAARKHVPGSRIVIFLIFANFGPRNLGYQRCFRPEKRQNGKKMEIYAFSLHTTHLQQARQRGAWRHSEGGGWGGGRREGECAHTMRRVFRP